MITLDQYGEDGVLEFRDKFYDRPRAVWWPIHKPAGEGGYNLSGTPCYDREELSKRDFVLYAVRVIPKELYEEAIPN